MITDALAHARCSAHRAVIGAAGAVATTVHAHRAHCSHCVHSEMAHQRHIMLLIVLHSCSCCTPDTSVCTSIVAHSVAPVVTLASLVPACRTLGYQPVRRAKAAFKHG
jgi:hypothetical protein